MINAFKMSDRFEKKPVSPCQKSVDIKEATSLISTQCDQMLRNFASWTSFFTVWQFFEVYKIFSKIEDNSWVLFYGNWKNFVRTLAKCWLKHLITLHFVEKATAVALTSEEPILALSRKTSTLMFGLKNRWARTKNLLEHSVQLDYEQHFDLG